MKEFIRKYEDRIHGVLSCFDRMLFRGYLPIMSGWAMAQFINSLDLKGSGLKGFLLESSERVKTHAIAMAQKHGWPFQYLVSNIRKEERARELDTESIVSRDPVSTTNRGLPQRDRVTCERSARHQRVSLNTVWGSGISFQSTFAYQPLSAAAWLISRSPSRHTAGVLSSPTYCDGLSEATLIPSKRSFRSSATR